jgi:hypothetical protein
LLDLGATIDAVVPWEGEVALGTLVEIMIANRLLNPKALFRIGDWAQQAGLTDYYGLTAEQLKDDRLGRALERLAVHAPTIQTAFVLKMVKTFKLNVRHMHRLTFLRCHSSRWATSGRVPPKGAYGRAKNLARRGSSSGA